METAVASSVDQHYVARFVLPVAAAFVAGLGQAIAQSNAIVAVSPFGGYTAQNHLNFNQQLGVAAGVAGNQTQNLLLQNAPKGPDRQARRRRQCRRGIPQATDREQQFRSVARPHSR